jgi:uncharacterized repeat protein (TIGR01451 family)
MCDLSWAAIYQITNTPDDEQLNDIATTPDGQVRVVWQTHQADLNVFAFTFTAPGTGADLAVTKTAPQYAVIGSNVSYTITVTNNGPAAASGVAVTDTLPSGTTLVSCTAPGGACNGTASVSAPFGSLASGATETATISVTAPASVLGGTVLTNTATVSATTPDPNSANNSSTAGTTLVYAVCPLYDSTRAVKSGAVIPIKLDLCDANGNDVSSAGVFVTAVSLTQLSSSATGTVEDVGNANPDNNFRYDATLGPTGGYVFNLSTRGLSTGTYGLNFTAGSDPLIHAAQFQVR